MTKEEYQGNKDLLGRKLTAFFSSRTIKTDKILACYDWATSLNPETDCVVSGFQSPIERDVLHFLMKKEIPVIVVLARRLYRKLPAELEDAYKGNRLLFISISNSVRNSSILAKQRNLYAGELVDNVVFGMISEKSSLYEIYFKLREKGKSIEII